MKYLFGIIAIVILLSSITSIAQTITKKSKQHLLVSRTACDPVKEDWTANFGSGLASSSYDVANAIVTDVSGNVYVTGESEGACTALDYATVKYDASGNQLWIARYNGPGNSSDNGRAIAVDALENVYVTGYSYGLGTSRDFATVKYDVFGHQLWVARYNGPGNFDDYAKAIAVDVAGNVYVAGKSASSPNEPYNYDYATIKYDASGNQLWVARYNGPGNSDDNMSALGLDALGNVYVTGSCTDSSSYTDYATLKYNASGEQLWIVRYNGPLNQNDWANCLALDAQSNVYVTGQSTISEANTEYATLKYDSLGHQQWVAHYDGAGYEDVPVAMAVDDLGNTYVTGTSHYMWHSEVATVKYNSSGNQLWLIGAQGQFGAIGAISLAIDASRNVYMTARACQTMYEIPTYQTWKYNSSGGELWTINYAAVSFWGGASPCAIAVDVSGNVYVTGVSDGDYATVKYVTHVEYGEHVHMAWVARYNGPGNSDDQATALVVDTSGNVYVTGQSYGSSTNLDYATVKYDLSGNQLWVARYNGPGNFNDRATDIAADASGNVYVTGNSFGSGTSWDYATVKYDLSGNQLWVARYNGPGNSDDQATALTVDERGNVYVTGMSASSSSPYNYDYATIKYDASGNQLWVERYNGPANSDDQATDLAVDTSENVYVTGHSVGLGTPSDYATVKYGTLGNQLWVARYDNTGYSTDRATALAIDSLGNVYVTGQSNGSGTPADYATIKYDAFGNQVWVARYDSTENSNDQATAIAVDVSGNVYVTGYSYVPGTPSDYATVKYDALGNKAWEAKYDGPSHSNDRATAIAIDATGNVYVTGLCYDSVSNMDFSTVKYDESGIPVWIVRYNGSGNSDDQATALVVDVSGNVYAAGYSRNNGSQYTTIKYSQNTTIEDTYPYLEGWNLISLPRSVADPSRTTVFPTSQSLLFEYNSSYVQRESLVVGKGYWLKFPLPVCITILGDSLAIDSLDVTGGWNMIGCISQPFPVSAITVEPIDMTTSEFFGYDGIQYVTTTTLLPGDGYWVKASKDGKLILDATLSASANANRIKIVPTSEPPPTPPDLEIQNLKSEIPNRFALGQCYPNPFNPSCVIQYALPERSQVILKVYNLLGQEIATLVNEDQPAGYYDKQFDARGLPSGIYIYRIVTSSGFRETRKMLLLR